MSFSVCSLMLETPVIIKKFISHYHHAGAEKIFIYIDQSVADFGLFEFPDFPNVTLTYCDNTFWEKTIGSTPSEFLERQSLVYHQAITDNISDWLLFCDADELILSDKPLGDVLDQLDKGTPGIRIRNTEAVWRTDDDISEPFSAQYERLPFPENLFKSSLLALLVYGRRWRQMRRGTTGHTRGKHLLRNDVTPDRIGSHTSIVDGKRLDFLHQIIPGEKDVRLLHYDAICFSRWLEKWQLRVDGATISRGMARTRRQQMNEIKESIHLGQAEKTFLSHNALNLWQSNILSFFDLFRGL